MMPYGAGHIHNNQQTYWQTARDPKSHFPAASTQRRAATTTASDRVYRGIIPRRAVLRRLPSLGCHLVWMASSSAIMMSLPGVHGVPFASHNRTTGHTGAGAGTRTGAGVGAGVGVGTTPPSSLLDFAVSGVGKRLEGLMIANLASAADAAATSASVGSDTQRGNIGGKREGGADESSAAEEWAGFVVKEGPNSVGYVTHLNEGFPSAINSQYSSR